MEHLKPEKILVTHALFGGDILKNELAEFGIKARHEDRLHIEIQGTIRDAVFLNLHLRTAHRVLLSLDNFQAASLDDLYRGIKNIPWEEVIPLNGYFSIHAVVRQPGIKDFRIASLKAKDAIADRFANKYGKRPDSGKETDRLVLFIYWINDFCSVYLDSSGDTIAKHGYRRHAWQAPLSESLAASIILSTVWDRKSAFINPMCGSATLTIEAAMIATGRFPGLYRNNYSFLHLKNPPFDEYQTLKKSLKSKIEAPKELTIIASDNHPGAIRQAQKNIDAAGLQEVIRLEKSDFRTTSLSGKPGVMVLNPPYGERMGDTEKLEILYTEIGDFFKNKCQGYTGYVFTGNPALGKKIGLRTTKKIPLMNGTIECRLLEYPLYAGSSGN